jgi:biopolymer transport protein ExbD
MKKYSKTEHHTLTELNITPLLDLAFVLLVIFIITTAPAVNDMEIALPSAASRPKERPSKANYITVDNSGKLFLNQYPLDEEQLLAKLVEFRQADPDLNVIVRGDHRIQYQKIISVLDLLVSAKVTKVGLATEAISGK